MSAPIIRRTDSIKIPGMRWVHLFLRICRPRSSRQPGARRPSRVNFKRTNRGISATHWVSWCQILGILIIVSTVPMSALDVPILRVPRTVSPPPIDATLPLGDTWKMAVVIPTLTPSALPHLPDTLGGQILRSSKPSNGRRAILHASPMPTADGWHMVGHPADILVYRGHLGLQEPDEAVVIDPEAGEQGIDRDHRQGRMEMVVDRTTAPAFAPALDQSALHHADMGTCRAARRIDA
jgi:hypothetical protein